MATVISGNTGIDKVQDGSIYPEDLTLSASSIGVGQTWQDVTASRALGTIYTNNTGKPIMVSVNNISTATSNSAVLTVGGVQIYGSANPNSGGRINVNAIVPSGTTYSASATNQTLSLWTELR